MSDLSVWTEEERPTRRRRRRRRRDHRGVLAVLVSLLIVFGLVGGAAAVLMGAGSRLKEVFSSSSTPDYPGPGTGEVQVEVRQGQTVAAVGRTLKAEDVIKSVDAFVQVANAEPESASLQPGFYKLQRRMPAAEALDLLLDPASRVQARVTLPEGLRLDEALKRLATGTGMPLAEYEKALADARSLGLPAYAKANAEGFLYPATYEVAPNARPAQVLEQLFATYTRVAREVGVERTQRPPYEIVIIASLVEGEARHAEDFGKVARVVYNRLTAGMPLQFDSTVNYALKADKEIVTHRDLGTDSDYNTYKHPGLPPGPISSPGKAALEAAINPTEGDWLYFVTVNPKTGETKFTGDYNEFLRFKRELKSNQ
jgi:UPF0755 protein